MTRCFHHSRLLHVSAEKILSTRIGQARNYLLLTLLTISFDHATSLEPQDTVLINFSRKYNDSGVVNHYVPSEETNIARMKEIDEASKNTSFSLTIDSTVENNEELPFGVNGREGRYYYRRPSSHLQVRSQRVHSSTTESISSADKSLSQGNDIQIEEISCRDTDDDVFFKASVKTTTAKESPVIDNVENEVCKVTRVKDEYTINLEKERFRHCGVVACSTDTERFYCLDLRFPLIPGLRLKDDTKITLRCKVQEKTVSRTKQIRVKTLDTSARMVPRVVTGGSQNTLEIDVGLFRKTFHSEKVFDTRIQSGDTVILGEEVLLRVLVRDGNEIDKILFPGWQYSRIGELTVHYIEKKQQKKIMNSLWILDTNGCLNPDVRKICSREQYRISPLETYLIFQAFMFENMRENDEIFLTVKVTGCLEGADCILNCPAGHNRRSRSVKTHNNTIDWENDISFRVNLPKEKIVREDLFRFHLVIPYVFVGCALSITAALLCTIRILLKQRIAKY
uniref:uncharacterized protein LOC127067401 isoform X1 n=2 Tax=Vespula vulgaris TaxID=7454 RepID=UPI00223B1768|nr:uncharacterized protein LOC127067401 isoform X1 [Vespula vulgaris]XP_050858196.1 uncharacterized protein LOC127067401 isoform X1 [Vespula vulgaris]XP_050858197.1 uncharacterized protein LOC127067401 isoform X1 [Vespula vulgaris]XP_050858198.1 uncharacterized protein LOC127067401 isoform X1 [Vespula vulgaris]